ncbi:MAG: ATPase domain-containing protein, partial [Bauldia sp.]
MALAARLRTQYVCQNCGAASPRWQGRCEACGEWNTMIGEAGGRGAAAGPAARPPPRGRVITLAPLAGDTDEAPRAATGIAEFDRVTGGGLVRGSTLLVAGDPGIGKSTLLRQVAAALAISGRPVVYV